MAMNKCKECGNKVSKKAKQCPACGAPTKASGGCLKVVAIIFGLLIAIGIISSLVNSSESSTAPSATTKEEAQAKASEKKTVLSSIVLQARSNLPTNQVDITIADGNTYKRCKITKIEPDGISVIHSAGFAKLAFPDLPQDYQVRYGYTEAEAQAYRQKLVEAARREQVAQAKQQIEQAKQKAKEQQAQSDEDFKKWVMDNSPVTDIAITSSTMFVTLTDDQYTNKDAVQRIADMLAESCCRRTGRNYVVCRIFYGKRLYAKGDFHK